MLALGFHIWSLSGWSTFLLHLFSWESLSWEDVVFCQMLFPHTEMIICIENSKTLVKVLKKTQINGKISHIHGLEE